MITRRRMLTILAGATALPALSPALAAQQQWRGIALGAEAQIILDHPDAQALIPMAVSEIQRLESIFSLYKADSQLSRLNQNGRLENPAFEMVELLSIAGQVHTQTNGAFDPTVQPLWALYAESYANGAAPSEAKIRAALENTGWDAIAFDADSVRFKKPYMALTLNGIAQGYIADRVTDLFRRNGVQEVLVNTGEIVGLGRWPIKTPKMPVTIENQAIATSMIKGTGFDGGGTVGHILDPRTGKPAIANNGVTVITHSATLADGLSTAFCIMDRKSAEKAGRNLPDNSHVIFV